MRCSSCGSEELVVPLLYAHVVRARLLRMEGTGVEDVEHELVEAERLAINVSALGLVPEIHAELAALWQREGRVEDARRELTRACDLTARSARVPTPTVSWRR
jgi:hypothetical protein